MKPPHVGLSEEQVDEHILGLILASHFSLKKGMALFGERAEKATTKELQAIHDMGTYGFQDASKLSKLKATETPNAGITLIRCRKEGWAH